MTIRSSAVFGHSRFLAITVGLILASSWLVSVAPAFAASGGGGGGSAGFANADNSPGQRAISEYRTGEKRLDRAKELRIEIAEASAAGDDGKAEKLGGKVTGMYERAERYFRKAIKYDEGLFQAWSALGYTLRSLGRYEEALEAYDTAIELEPRYAEAVEYRAEAYLHLGRIDEAKAEYLRLAGWVQPMAAMLIVKMQEWQHARVADPGSMDPEAVAAFGLWLEERRAEDGMPASVSAAQRAEW